ncbi:Protein kinase domain [Trypanosoma melophagium]|uniref:Protein kinase domain n=1 Tax=Trypanosoma melophagium TaxID=715481 RepID=UPI00351A2C00|nr:Protein kinase domain [Trypanosoma melophagium]
MMDAEMSPPTVFFTQTLSPQQYRQRRAQHREDQKHEEPQRKQREKEKERKQQQPYEKEVTEEEQERMRREWVIFMKSKSAVRPTRSRDSIKSTRSSSSSVSCNSRNYHRPLLTVIDTDEEELSEMKEESEKEIQSYNDRSLTTNSYLLDYSLQKRHEGYKRYKILFPLNWSAGKEEDVMLARDSVMYNLVITRLYRYRNNDPSTAVVIETTTRNCKNTFNCKETNKYTDPILGTREAGKKWIDDTSCIPFSASWKQRLYDLRNLHHAYITPVLDVVISVERRELLMVHPYMDGMQPLAALIQNSTHLTYFELTPLLFSRIMREIIDGVLFLHRHGVMHGALSPWTVILNEEGHVQITGFAISHHHHNNNNNNNKHTLEEEEEPQRHGQREQFSYFCNRVNVDVFAVGILTLTLMAAQRVSHAVHTETVRRAVFNLINNDPMKRIKLEEFAEVMKSIAVTPSRGLYTESKKRKEGDCLLNSQSTITPTRAINDSPPFVISTLTTALTTTTTTTTAGVTQTLPVEGILQRNSSPLLYRTIGLDKRGKVRTSETPHSSRSLSSSSGRKTPHRGSRSILSKWRIVAFVVFLCRVLIRMAEARRKPLTAWFLVAPQEGSEEWERHRRSELMGVVSNMSKPRRPRSLDSRRLLTRSRSTVSI